MAGKSRPWRAAWTHSADVTDVAGEQDAYRAAQGMAATGDGTIRIYHWEGGRWRRYEDLDAGELRAMGARRG